MSFRCGTRYVSNCARSPLADIMGRRDVVADRITDDLELVSAVECEHPARRAAKY